MEYEFVLRYQLIEGDVNDALLERLAEVGCEDALIGIGLPGRLSLEFVRESPNAKEAIENALEADCAAVPSARLIEASPDLVGLSDALRRMKIAAEATSAAHRWHLDRQLHRPQRMRTRIKEMQRRPRQIAKPLYKMPLLIHHRGLAQGPDGNRKMRRPRLANRFEQVLVTAVQMLPEQA